MWNMPTPEELWAGGDGRAPQGPRVGSPGSSRGPGQCGASKRGCEGGAWRLETEGLGRSSMSGNRAQDTRKYIREPGTPDSSGPRSLTFGLQRSKVNPGLFLATATRKHQEILQCLLQIAACWPAGFCFTSAYLGQDLGRNRGAETSRCCCRHRCLLVSACLFPGFSSSVSFAVACVLASVSCSVCFLLCHCMRLLRAFLLGVVSVWFYAVWYICMFLLLSVWLCVSFVMFVVCCFHCSLSVVRCRLFLVVGSSLCVASGACCFFCEFLVV